jgi:hypothetical protein
MVRCRCVGVNPHFSPWLGLVLAASRFGQAFPDRREYIHVGWPGVFPTLSGISHIPVGHAKTSLPNRLNVGRS